MTAQHRRGASSYAPCAALVSLALVLTACGSTLDSLGQSPATGGGAGAAALPPLSPLSGPASYPSAFRDLIGKADADVNAKIDAAFAQLFHGDLGTQAIYFPIGTDQAQVQDILHVDVRSEGVGVLMVVAVELNKQDEFDKLWRYAKAALEQTTGPGVGYFNSFCDDGTPCLDPYGMEQFVSALLFASDRWGNGGALSYASDANVLLDLLRNKQEINGGVVAGTISAFDPATDLVREQPTVSAAGYTRTALEMPAEYTLWAQATGDSFWTAAATAARAHLAAAANTTTGLWPMRSYFDGAPVTGFDSFSAQAFRTHFNLALDALWFGNGASVSTEADRLLGFFTAQGLDKYGTTYKLDGTVVDATHDPGLVAANGALAIAATRANRTDFVNAVWAMPIPSGDARYYDGILYLMSLLVLSGQYRVY